MPYKGSPQTSARLEPSPSEDAEGADLLLTLAESASEKRAPQHLPEETAQETFNATKFATATSQQHQSGFHYRPTDAADDSRCPPVTPSPLVHLSREPNIIGSAVVSASTTGEARSKNMQMSVHGSGTHRLVPSPIKLPKSEQRQQQQHELHHGIKRRPPAEHENLDDETMELATSKKQRSVHASPTQEPSYSAEENTVISPASSNEVGQKSPEGDDHHHQQQHPVYPSYHLHHMAPYGHLPANHHPYHGQHWPHHPSRHHVVPPAGYYASSAPYAPVPPLPSSYYTATVHYMPAAVYSHHSSSSPVPAQQPCSTKDGNNAKTCDDVNKSIEQWQKTRVAVGNKARCVPLEHPTKARRFVPAPEDMDTKLPDFPLLVNFPEHLTRGQTRGTGGDKGLAPEGKRHCVMCGELRICSSSANRLNRSSAPAEGTDSTVHIIPRQNKGVCTACDVTVWTVKDATDLEIKWCKGCKNFRPWPAFGDKGLATKCARCRHRQREKYALQKKVSSSHSNYDIQKEDDIMAAQGLSNLMRAQNTQVNTNKFKDREGENVCGHDTLLE